MKNEDTIYLRHELLIVKAERDALKKKNTILRQRLSQTKQINKSVRDRLISAIRFLKKDYFGQVPEWIETLINAPFEKTRDEHQN